MIVLPAIDIKGGKVVRLVQGRFDDVTEYSQDPVEVAQHWKAQGAKFLHVVDLDGAETGQFTNSDIVKKIKRETGLTVQAGGGIRSESVIETLLNPDDGIDRVILGTSVLSEDGRDIDFQFLSNVLEKWRAKIGISLDCVNGYIAYRGWTKTTDLKGVVLAKELEDLGVQWLIYTDIAKDGMLSGPNFEAVVDILNAVSMNVHVIASGGVASLDDIEKLHEINTQSKDKNLFGVITGKALYENKLDLKEAIKVCS